MTVSVPRKELLALVAILVLLLSSPRVAAAQDSTVEASSDDYTVVSQSETPTGVNTVVRVNVSQDSFLSSLNANNNYGSSPQIRMGWASGSYNALRPMLQFNLGGIPSNATINSARLYIYLFQSIPYNDYPMTFRGQFVNSAWNEYGVTWNNANYLGGTSLPLSDSDNVVGWRSTDVTSLVHTWQSGAQPNYGLIITGDEVPSEDRSRAFASRRIRTWRLYRCRLQRPV